MYVGYKQLIDARIVLEPDLINSGAREKQLHRGHAHAYLAYSELHDDAAIEATPIAHTAAAAIVAASGEPKPLEVLASNSCSGGMPTARKSTIVAREGQNKKNTRILTVVVVAAAEFFAEEFFGD